MPRQCRVVGRTGWEEPAWLQAQPHRDGGTPEVTPPPPPLILSCNEIMSCMHERILGVLKSYHACILPRSPSPK